MLRFKRTLTPKRLLSMNPFRRPAAAPITDARSPRIRTDIPIPPVAYLDRKIRAVPNLTEIWSYINPFMIYGRHLGFRGNFEKALSERDPRALELFNNMEEVRREAATFMKISAVWQFFEAERNGNSIALYAPDSGLADSHFSFPAPELLPAISA